MDELNNYNFSGVDSIPLSLIDPQKGDGEFNFSGVDSLTSKISPPKKQTKAFDSFQPESTDWNATKFSDIENWYQKTFSSNIPAQKGQKIIHNRWGLDHRDSADVNLNPRSAEGQKVIEYLKQNNIPFLAFTRSIPGVSTGAHIHIGMASHKTNKKYKVGEILGTDQEDQQKTQDSNYNFSGIDNLDNETKSEESKYSFANVDTLNKTDQESKDDLISTSTIEFTGTPEEQNKKKAAYKEFNKQKILSENKVNLADIFTKGIPDSFSVPLEIKPEELETDTTKRGFYLAAKAAGVPNIQAMVFAEQREAAAKAKGRGGLYQQFSDTKLTPQEVEKLKTEGYTKFTLSDPEDIKVLRDLVSRSGLQIGNQTFSPKQAKQIRGFVADAQNAGAAYRGASEAAGTGIEELYNILGGAVEATKELSPTTLGLDYLSRKIAGKSPINDVSSSLYKEGDIYSAATDILRSAHPEEERIEGQRTSSWAPFSRDITSFLPTAIKLTATSPLGPAQLPVLGYFENRRAGIVPALKGGGIGILYQVALGGLGKIFEPLEGATKLLDESISETLSPTTKRIISHLGQGGAFTAALAGSGVLQGQSLEQAFIQNAPFSILPFLHEGKDKLIGKLAKTTNENGEVKYGGLVAVKDNNEQYKIEFQELQKDHPLIQKWLSSNENKEANLSDGEFEALKSIERVAKDPTPDQHLKNVEEKTGENILQRLIRTTNEIRDRELENNDEAKSIIAKGVFGDIGNQNKFVNQESAFDAYGRFVKRKGQDKMRSGLTLDDLKESTNAIHDLTQIAAFHLEDFYHRHIEPSIDEFANRMRLTLGDAVKNFKDSDFKNIFDLGNNYLKSNIADPFFSKMKQDVIEKLPNKVDVNQVRNILSQHKNESEWTVGLEDFLRENEGKKISKKDLIDVIQRGQVKVEASIAQDRWISVENDPIHQELENARGEILRDMYDSEKNKTRTEQEFKDIDRRKFEIEQKLDAREEEINKINSSSQPKYSIKYYSEGKLELPGAENSKEVKLISPLERTALENQVEYENYLLKKYNLGMQGFDRLYDNSTLTKEENDKLVELGNANAIEYKVLYKDPHFDELNIVAHYRSNDRITTDNIPINFIEEAQSQWNQEGVKVGFKLSNEEKQELNKLQNMDEFHSPEEQARWFELNKRNNNTAVEPNPFMGNLWKELVWKRALRDSVIAKDENGNYKYNGIGWTTARQQQERYNKLLSSTELRVHRVLTADQQPDYGQLNKDIYEIEAKSSNGTFVNIPNAPTRGTLKEWEPIVGKEYVEKIRQSNFDKDEVINDETNYAREPRYIKGSELTFGDKGYADYDNAYKNILSRIGKRFGANYSQKEIETTRPTPKLNIDESNIDEALGLIEQPYNIEKIHFLEITPSMRSSLEREGFPIYGTGGSETLKSQEFGARNRIVTSDPFNQAREDLINKILKENENTENPGTVFNSGLNPDDLVSMIKLTYSGFKDFASFSNALIKQYGETIRVHVEDLWFQVKGFGKDLDNHLTTSINEWQDSLAKNRDDPAWKMREGEHGFITIGGKKIQRPLKNDPELRDFLDEKPSVLDYRAIINSVGLAQVSPEFNKIYDIHRDTTRVGNSVMTDVTNNLGNASSKDIKINDKVSEAIFKSNEIGTTRGSGFTDAELAQQGLSIEEIQSFKKIRQAQDLALNIELQKNLYIIKEKARVLTEQLLGAVKGSPKEDAIKNKLLDLSDQQNKLQDHYQQLFKEHYISTQRSGDIAVVLHDPNFPVGDPREMIYNQFDSRREAKKWIRQQKKILGIDPNVTIGKMYYLDPANLRDLVSRENLTPGQFETLVSNSSADPTNSEIEKLRTEVYSKFPSSSYQLDRKLTRGYDRNFSAVVQGVLRQASRYTASFYSTVAGTEAKKQLAELERQGLKDSDPNLYKLTAQYINDEISSTKQGWFSKNVLARGRTLTFVKQLAGDVNQLWMRAIGHPVTQQLGYFARVEYGGERLTGVEPETYFGKATKLAHEELLGINKDKDFSDLVQQLKNEKVISPRFTRSLVELQAEQPGTIPSNGRLMHWATIFMRGGEISARMNAAAEGYLVGKEKFKLFGDELAKFVTRAVDATNTNPTKGENPYIVRKTGEGGKLVFQFMAFEHLWWQNLALGTALDKTGTIGQKAKFTTRELYPLAIIGGLRGLPLAGMAGTLYTILTGRDSRKQVKRLLGNDNALERTALYGVTESASLSQRMAAPAKTGQYLLEGGLAKRNLIGDLIPAYATAEQIISGADHLLTRGKRFQGLEEIAPRAISGPLKAIDYAKHGIKTSSGDTLVPRGKLTTAQLLEQGINIVPTQAIEKREAIRTERIKDLVRSKRLGRKMQNQLRKVLS